MVCTRHVYKINFPLDYRTKRPQRTWYPLKTTSLVTMQKQSSLYTDELEMLLIQNALCWSSQKCNCACALPAEVQLRLHVTRRSWQKLFAGKNFEKNFGDCADAVAFIQWTTEGVWKYQHLQLRRPCFPMCMLNGLMPISNYISCVFYKHSIIYQI